MMMKKMPKNSSFPYYTIPLSEDIKATIRALQYKKRSEPRYTLYSLRFSCLCAFDRLYPMQGQMRFQLFVFGFIKLISVNHNV